MTPERLKDLARAFHVEDPDPEGFTEDDPPDDGCNRCHQSITLRDGSAEPPYFCDECAQEMVLEVPALLAEVDALTARVRELEAAVEDALTEYDPEDPMIGDGARMAGILRRTLATP